jgi:hypothetical protein
VTTYRVSFIIYQADQGIKASTADATVTKMFDTVQGKQTFTQNTDDPVAGGKLS